MKSHSLLIIPLLFVAAPACNSLSNNSEREVDKKMVAQLSEAEQKDVREAQMREAKARDQLAAAKLATDGANRDLKVAKQELQVADAEVKKAEFNMTAAETGTTESVDKARAAHDEALTLPQAARGRIALRERQIDRSKAREELAAKRVELSVAIVELERAKAVSALDRPNAKQVDVAGYEHDMRRAEEAVELARVKLDAAGKETEIARTEYKVRVEAIPATYRGTWREDVAEDRTREALDLEDEMKK